MTRMKTLKHNEISEELCSRFETLMKAWRAAGICRVPP